jgi:thiosulfate dehydrogenase (quinone) large subunit
MSYDGSSGPSWGLVLVRITVGSILLYAGWMKLSMGVDPAIVSGTRDAFAKAPGLVRWWGEKVVLPNPTLFAHLITWGEVLIGLSLFLGALTRPAGMVGAFLFANFWFAGPEMMQMFVLLLAACCLGCALSYAGRRAGADVFLDERLPAWMTWTRGA